MLTTNVVLFLAIACFVGLLTIASNMLVLVLFARYQVFYPVTRLFVGNLALADLLIGVSTPPILFLTSFGLPRDFYECVFANSLAILLTNISIQGFVTVTLERYLAISKPYVYVRVANTRRGLCVIAFTWVFGILIGLLPVMGWHSDIERYKGSCCFQDVMMLTYQVYFVFFGLYMPTMIFEFFVYLHIFNIVKRQIKSSHIMAEEGTILAVGTQRKRKIREVRAAKTLSLVVLLFAVCWLPDHIVNTVLLFYPQTEHDTSFSHVQMFAIILSRCNSLFNPMIFVFNNKNVREAVRRLWRGDRRATFNLPFIPSRLSTCKLAVPPSATPSISGSSNEMVSSFVSSISPVHWPPPQAGQHSVLPKAHSNAILLKMSMSVHRIASIGRRLNCAYSSEAVPDVTPHDESVWDKPCTSTSLMSRSLSAGRFQSFSRLQRPPRQHVQLHDPSEIYY